MSKRTVFISYYGDDTAEVDNFVYKWGEENKIFIPKILGVNNEDDIINSNDSEYVMSQIRKNYLGDSTVTIVLVGPCTHSRRYVDWEIKSSLTQGENNTPNGLMVIFLNTDNEALPERFKENFSNDKESYARCYSQPKSGQQLSDWIEDAFQARTQRAELIVNSQSMMKYNTKCKKCGITHSTTGNATVNEASNSAERILNPSKPWSL